MSTGDDGRAELRAVELAEATRTVEESIEGVRRAVRRQGAERKQLGPKAERTRQRLLDSAADVFGTQDYNATSPTHIAERAEVSLATFYQYFADLPSLIMSMAGAYAIDWLGRQLDDWHPSSGRIGLRQAIHSSLTGFAENASFYRAWEQACATDPRVEDLRRMLWAPYKKALERRLVEGMELGLVRGDVDAAETARALTFLVNRYSYDAIVHDPPPGGPDLDAAADLLCTLWADAIGLRESPTYRTAPATPERRRRR